MPGSSFRSGFGHDTTTGYVTTFCVVVDLKRICSIWPTNVSSG